MKNIHEIKKNAMSEQGKKYQAELEDLNWILQEKQFELVKLQKKFEHKSLLYKQFLGYDVNQEELEKLTKEIIND